MIVCIDNACGRPNEAWKPKTAFSPEGKRNSIHIQLRQQQSRRQPCLCFLPGTTAPARSESLEHTNHYIFNRNCRHQHGTSSNIGRDIIPKKVKNTLLPRAAPWCSSGQIQSRRAMRSQRLPIRNILRSTTYYTAHPDVQTL